MKSKKNPQFLYLRIIFQSQIYLQNLIIINKINRLKRKKKSRLHLKLIYFLIILIILFPNQAEQIIFSIIMLQTYPKHKKPRNQMIIKLTNLLMIRMEKILQVNKIFQKMIIIQHLSKRRLKKISTHFQPNLIIITQIIHF